PPSTHRLVAPSAPAHRRVRNADERDSRRWTSARPGYVAGLSAPSARPAAASAGDPAYACAMADRPNTRQVVTQTATATTKPAQYGAVIPNVDATPPASRAPAQLPPAAMNRFVLPTRPSIAGGVSRCRSELATIVHSVPCTPNAKSAKPTT